MAHEIAISVEPTSDNNRRIIRGALEYIATQPDLTVFKNLAIPFIDWKASLSWNGAGLITGAETVGLCDSLHGLAASQTKIVSVSMHQTPDPMIPTIGSDNHAIGRVLAEHLLEVGLKRFAFVGRSDWYHNRLRCEGFCEAIAAAGHDCHVIELKYVMGKERPTGAYHNIGHFDLARLTNEIDKLRVPIGIAAAHDEFADAVMESCRILQKRLPYDVAIIGVNNYRLVCESCDPPLSSVPQAGEQIGFEAASLLHRMIQGETIRDRVMTLQPGPVVVRRSTDFLAVDDKDVVEAIRLIRSKFHEKITTEFVAESLAIGRKTLDKRFVKFLGHRVAEEIRRTRLRYAKVLLSTTSLQIVAIGLRCGYSSTSGFVRAFREETGQTPLKFQRQSRKSGFDQA